MKTIYKVEGEIKQNTFSMLSLALGCIESRKINHKEAIITVFKERGDIEIIFADFGLKILEIIENT